MAKDRDTSRWPGLEVAIEGAGLSPADISARQLAALLEAAVALFERVAEERGTKVGAPRLIEVTTGSAAYALRSPDAEAAAIFDAIEEIVENRGVGASFTIRQRLDRLHKAGKGVGSVRIARFEGKRRAAKVVHVAPPLDLQPPSFEESRELYGVVIAVDAGQRKGATVKVRLDDGASQEFNADLGLAQRAARLFTKPVRALVTYTVIGDQELDGHLEELDPWEAADELRDEPLAAFDIVRDVAKREHIRASDWLDELFADDED